MSNIVCLLTMKELALLVYWNLSTLLSICLSVRATHPLARQVEQILIYLPFCLSAYLSVYLSILSRLILTSVARFSVKMCYLYNNAILCLLK